jgi:hypothetical protein
VRAFLLLALSAFALTAVSLADCRVHPRDKIALIGSADDPDVFVWDSRFRLANYQTGTWDVSKSLLPHALLARPGTRAMVISCVPNFVHPKFRMALDDAIGIIITSGDDRGKSGWVLGQDVQRVLGQKP